MRQIKNRYSGTVIGDFEIGPGANLYGADLYGADLYGADLYGADLRGANLRLAILSCANLRGANLSVANLYGANLSYADLRGTNLRDANLSYADLRGTNLRDANLSGANLSGADLRGAKLNWNSHNLLGEILRQAAKDNMERRALAGLVAFSTDKCHDYWMGFAHPEKEWAISVLRQWDCEQSPAPEWILSKEERPDNVLAALKDMADAKRNGDQEKLNTIMYMIELAQEESR